MKKAFQAAEPRPIEPAREHRARGFHRPGRLLVVALLLLTAFTAFGVFVWGVVDILQIGRRESGWLALGGLGVFIVARTAAFVLARTLTCPLCHGTVMQEGRCLKHADAFRIRPLSHRASAVLMLLCTGAFRCMYCGTAYRLRR